MRAWVCEGVHPGVDLPISVPKGERCPSCNADERVAARIHPPVVPDPEQGCDACGEPMTNHDADGQWCDKHGKPSAAPDDPMLRG